MTDDRTVHATDRTFEVARYDCSGRWFLEPIGPGKRRAISLAEAVEIAVEMAKGGGLVRMPLPGGRAFEAAYRRARRGSR